MGKNRRKEKRSIRSNWIKLILELIAVFVGITAGFIFDSYREDRANRKQEEKYLSSFQNNLVADSIEIHNHIQSNQNNVDISRRAVATMQTANLTWDSALVVIQMMATYNNLNLQDATYESIVNSGNLGLIRDFRIREEIVNYYRFLDDIQYLEEVYNNYITDYVVPFVFKYMDLISGEAPEDFDPGSREFRNITSGYYVLASQKMDLTLELDSINNNLKNSIYNSKF